MKLLDKLGVEMAIGQTVAVAVRPKGSGGDRPVLRFAKVTGLASDVGIATLMTEGHRTTYRPSCELVVLP